MAIVGVDCKEGGGIGLTGVSIEAHAGQTGLQTSLVFKQIDGHQSDLTLEHLAQFNPHALLADFSFERFL